MARCGAVTNEALMSIQQVDCVRVVTWNLWWRFGAWQERLEAIAEVLREIDADFCGLQEVWADEVSNEAVVLAERLGMYASWVPTPAPDRWQRRLGDPTVTMGNAVLSRWPVVNQRHIHLPAGTDTDEGRTAMLAEVASPYGRISMYNTQLNSAPSHSAVRVEQVVALAQFIGRHVADAFPIVLTGDFNALPDSDEVRLMEGHLTAPAVTGLLLIDTWRYAAPGNQGFTWNRRNPHVAATFEPSARIDYVFVGPPGPTGQGHVVSVDLVGDQPRHGIWPSDHAGVVVDLQTRQH
jgi:endonuclease/exonuclease/phosphatase family metal-dependent hydrolase